MFGKVGMTTNAVGLSVPPGLTVDTKIMVAGDHEEDTRLGRVFAASNQAAVAITAAMATTYTGLVLGNPVASGIDITVLLAQYASTIAIPTATALGLMTGVGASIVGSIAGRNRLVGGAAPVGQVDDACTLPGTPVLEEPFATAWTEATTAGTLSRPNRVWLKGTLVLPPGGFVAFYSTAANSAAFLFGFLWKETPHRTL
jgi:hypothetical protein